MKYWHFVSGSCACYLYGALEFPLETFSLKSLTVVNKDSDIIDDFMRERLNVMYRKYDNNLVCIHDSPVLDE